MPSNGTRATGDTRPRCPPIPGGQAAPLTPYLRQHQRQRRFTALTATAAKGAVKRGAFTYRLVGVAAVSPGLRLVYYQRCFLTEVYGAR